MYLLKADFVLLLRVAELFVLTPHFRKIWAPKLILGTWLFPRPPSQHHYMAVCSMTDWTLAAVSLTCLHKRIYQWLEYQVHTS